MRTAFDRFLAPFCFLMVLIGQPSFDFNLNEFNIKDSKSIVLEVVSIDLPVEYQFLDLELEPTDISEEEDEDVMLKGTHSIIDPQSIVSINFNNHFFEFLGDEPHKPPRV